jgi:hypothetical protein
MEVELAGSVSSRGEQDVSIFPPEFVWRGTVYIPAPSQRILACDPQALTSRAVPLFWRVVPKISWVLGSSGTPFRIRGLIGFPPGIVSLQPGPSPGCNSADFLKASLEVRFACGPVSEGYGPRSPDPFRTVMTVVRPVRGMDPVRLAIPDR